MLKNILEELIEGKYNYTDQRVKEQKIIHAVSEIMKLVPGKKDIEGKTLIQDIREGDFDYGWNACVQQLKTNFGEGRNDKTRGVTKSMDKG